MINLVGFTLAAMLFAQQNGPTPGCGPRPAIMQMLERMLGNETPEITRSTEGAVMMEDIQNSHRWMKLATRKDGLTCIIGSGLRI